MAGKKLETGGPRNVEFYETKDGKLAVEIDPNANFGPSQSGKSDIVASTGRPMDITVGGKVVTVSMTVFEKHGTKVAKAKK